MHRDAETSNPNCRKFGKEVTLIWQVGKTDIETAFSSHHLFGYKHGRFNGTTNLATSFSNFIYTFSIYFSSSHVIMSCKIHFRRYSDKKVFNAT